MSTSSTTAASYVSSFGQPNLTASAVGRMFTLQDAIDAILNTEGADSTGSHYRSARAAVMEAYREVADKHNWSYFRRRGVLTTEAYQSTGTITYTHSTRIVTISGATFPTSSVYWRITIAGVSYPIEEYLTSTTVRLPEGFNPGANVASGTAYSLARTEYPVPADFRQGGEMIQLQGTGFSIQHTSPRDLLQYLACNNSPQDNSLQFTIHGSKTGELVFELAPPPASAKQYEYIYRAIPRPAVLFNGNAEYVTGTVSVSGQTVTGSGTTFTSAMEGCIFRLTSSTTTAPTGIDGRVGTDNPYDEQFIITSVTNGTTLTLSGTPTGTYSAVKYSICSHVDVDAVSMRNYFHRLCDVKFAIKTRMANKDLAERIQLMTSALREAIVADNRIGDLEWQSDGPLMSVSDGDAGFVIF